jgi:hypothetical protein
VIETDDEIRASAAFPALVDALRVPYLVFLFVLPPAAAVAIYGVFGPHAHWAFIVFGAFCLLNLAGQLQGFRRARIALSALSDSADVQARARKLADDAAKPRVLRWLPGG